MALGTSPINLPQSSSGRLLVIIVLRRFVAPHDDLEQHFAGAAGQLLHAHVIDDQQVGLQIPREHFVVFAEHLVVQEVAHHIEDRTIQHRGSPA